MRQRICRSDPLMRRNPKKHHISRCRFESCAKSYKQLPGSHILLHLGSSFIDTCNRIQASRIPDAGQALGNDPDEEILVIAQVHIAFGMSDELRLASALGGEEAEGDYLTLL